MNKRLNKGIIVAGVIALLFIWVCLAFNNVDWAVLYAWILIGGGILVLVATNVIIMIRRTKYVKNILSSLPPLSWMLSVLCSLIKGGTSNNIVDKESWQEEKEDIIARASWLCEKVIVNPEKLLGSMPAILGPHYGGEWAIYSCSMLAFALANICKLYPEEKEKNIERVKSIINLVNTPEIRHYDTMSWKEDAMLTLSGEKSHMTYLSILAWIISLYKLMGGNGEFDSILHLCCKTLNKRMLQKKDLNLPSFPNNIIFIPDMMFTILALNNYSKLYDGMYSDTVSKWLENVKTKLIHKKTGLIVSIIYPRRRYKPIRGSYTALTCSCLTMVDENLAEDQYFKLKQIMLKEVKVLNTRILGIKEYLRKMPIFKMDVDAGPISFGLSPSGTAFILGAATYFKDWELRSQLLRTAEIAGQSVKKKNMRHYRLGKCVLVGEAVCLAMRTNVKWQ